VEIAESLSIVEGRPPRTYRVMDFQSVEELGFQLLDRKYETVLQVVKHLGEAGLLVSPAE
jgi:hypothetical protein